MPLKYVRSTTAGTQHVRERGAPKIPPATTEYEGDITIPVAFHTQSNFPTAMWVPGLGQGQTRETLADVPDRTREKKNKKIAKICVPSAIDWSPVPPLFGGGLLSTKSTPLCPWQSQQSRRLKPITGNPRSKEFTTRNRMRKAADA